MMAFYIKQNDTSPSLRAQLKDGDDIPVDLTGATIRFHMRAIGGATAAVDASAQIITPDISGIVQYDWDNGDTATIGSYQAEFEVTFAGGAVETFPNSGYIRVEIIDDIT